MINVTPSEALLEIYEKVIIDLISVTAKLKYRHLLFYSCTLFSVSVSFACYDSSLYSKLMFEVQQKNRGHAVHV